MGNCPNNILNARQASGLSQKAVAITLSVSSPTVSDWERERKYPTVENLKQLSDLFCVSTDYLLRRTNTPTMGQNASSDWEGDILLQLRKEANQPPERVSEATGIALSLYIQYEKGTLEPSISDLVKLADHFCTGTDLLLKRETPLMDGNRIATDSFRTTSEEQHLIEIFRQLSAVDQSAVRERALTLYEQSKQNPTPASGESAG